MRSETHMEWELADADRVIVTVWATLKNPCLGIHETCLAMVELVFQDQVWLIRSDHQGGLQEAVPGELVEAAEPPISRESSVSPDPVLP